MDNLLPFHARRTVVSVLLAQGLCATPIAHADELQVEVVGDRGRGLARVADLLAPITGPDWLSQPSSLSVISVSEGRALGAQRLVDLMQADPSVELNYAPAGYYENLQVRGFAVDPVLGYRVNGLPVVGEMPFWMRPYEDLEFVRGPVGAWLGGGSGGGLVNLVTGRPGPHTSMPLVLLEAQSHGGRSVALDQSFGSAAGTRVRLIAEQSRLHASAPGTEGDAHGLALAVEQDLGVWQLEVDLQARRQAQLTQPGAQLLGGSELPPVSPDRSLGFSSWSQPTVFRSRLAQLRLSRNLSMLAPGWQLHLGLSDHSVTTDDRSSFPWGCSNGTDPYFLFCSNGDFTLWDYQSLGEHRSMRAIQTTAYGPLRLMGHVGIASLGLASANRQTHLPQYSWQPTDAGLVDTGNVFSGTWTGQPLPAVPYEAFRSELRQQSLSLSWTGRAGPVGVPVPSLTIRLVEALQGYESAFWTPRPWTSTRDSQVLGAAGLSLPISADERISLSWREDLEAGQRVPVTAANDGELLPPRTLSALELGYKWARSSRERLSITVFRSTRPYDLRQDEQSVPAYPGPYIRQGRESRTGLEWVAQQALSTAWRLEWTGSWTDSEVSGTGLQWLDGTEVSNLPRLRSRLRLEARSAAGGPEVQLAVTGVSGRWATRGETVRVPGYARLDLGLGLPMTGLGRGARAQLAVQNVLDRRYWADASEFLGDAYLTPGSSRTLTLSLSLPL